MAQAMQHRLDSLVFLLTSAQILQPYWSCLVIHRYSHRTPSAEALAAQACEIEINRLGEPIGKQDQYIAAVGGVSTFTFRDDESVEVERLAMTDITRSQLEDNLLLF